MYLFLAHYSNVYTGEQTTRKIEFDGNFCYDEKDCYIYAMGIAYDMTKKDECLDSVELLAC